MTELVRLEVEEAVATITLDSPANRNALSNQLLEELAARLRRAAEDPEVRCVVLTATGSVFCSGADLSTPGSVASAPVTLVDVLTLLWEYPKGTIVALNGHVRAGGIGLVASADVVLAPTKATFAFSEVRIGVAPAIIATLCGRTMSPRSLSRFMLTGEVFDAQSALDSGLLTFVGEEAELAEQLRTLSEAMALGEPTAVASTKALLRELPAMSVAEGFRHAEALSARLFATPEAQEGIAAMREKRRPSWAPTT
jgi:methylglutaconyl-CoA hydratase